MGSSELYAGPRIASSGGGTYLISNTETLGMYSSGKDSLVTTGGSVDLSPVDPIAFSWLSGPIRSWQRYRYRQLEVWYESICSTSEAGEVAYALLFDVMDLTPVRTYLVSEILAFGGARRGNVWSCPGGVVYDSKRATYPWYPVHPPAAAENMSVPCTLVYSGYAKSTNTPIGRFMVRYTIEVTDAVPQTVYPSPTVLVEQPPDTASSSLSRGR